MTVPAYSMIPSVRPPRRRNYRKARHDDIIDELTSSCDTYGLDKRAVPHPHRLVDINVVMIVTITFRSGWQDGIMPTKPLQIHDLVSTIAATGVFKDRQEKEPPMTISKDEQLRLDAAAVVVDLLWSWAPLHSGWGTMYLCP